MISSATATSRPLHSSSKKRRASASFAVDIRSSSWWCDRADHRSPAPTCASAIRPIFGRRRRRFRSARAPSRTGHCRRACAGRSCRRCARGGAAPFAARRSAHRRSAWFVSPRAARRSTSTSRSVRSAGHAGRGRGAPAASITAADRAPGRAVPARASSVTVRAASSRPERLPMRDGRSRSACITSAAASSRDFARECGRGDAAVIAGAVEPLVVAAGERARSASASERASTRSDQ